MTRILVVDDDDQLRPLLQHMLRQAGYEALAAANGAEALAVLQEHPVALLITDLIMPDKEGIETILELRRAGRELPIIAISGGGRGDADSYLATAKACGADRVLAKPFERRELLQMVEDLLETTAAS